MPTVGIVGASGLLGSHLGLSLEKQGWQTVHIARSQPCDYVWNYEYGRLDPERISEFDALVSLAGEPLAQRWTPRSQDRMWKSRVDLTAGLAESIRRAASPPLVWLSASAVGYYGDTGDVVVDESTPAGRGWVCRLGKAWEGAASIAGTRVVPLRTGLVLSPEGGLLEQMKTPFKFGVGAPLGHGKQYMPWIHLDDWVSMACWLLERDDIQGPVNLTAPQPVTNAEFSKTLGRVLKRPVWPIGIPRFVLRAVLGDMADLALEGQRAVPKKALQAGYDFLYTDLDSALRDVLQPKV